MTKALVMASWDDVPHLTEADKKDLLEGIPEYQRDARSKGIPTLGAGAIYAVPESDLRVEPFKIPVYWPRGYALDVGWNVTAGLFGAHDRETDTLYLYEEVYAKQREPVFVADAIRRRGGWMHGVIDPAARGRGQKDGEQLLQVYRDLGLTVTPAVNAVEAGIYEVWSRMGSGRLKVFSTLVNWWSEFRVYHRDEKGNIVKKADHLMDSTKYLCVSGIPLMMTKPAGAVGARADVGDYDPLTAN